MADEVEFQSFPPRALDSPAPPPSRLAIWCYVHLCLNLIAFLTFPGGFEEDINNFLWAALIVSALFLGISTVFRRGKVIFRTVCLTINLIISIVFLAGYVDWFRP